MIIYFDSSALVKAFVHESGSSEVRQFIERTFPRKDVIFATSAITKAEIACALSAMRRARELTEPKYEQAVSHFLDTWPAFEIVQVTKDLVDHSCEIGLHHKVKGGDAFQLSSAIAQKSDLLVSSDHDLNHAAKVCDLWVWNPIENSAPEF